MAKLYRIIFCILTFLSSILCAETNKYNISFNIISWNNNAGLTRDYKILESELVRLGCSVNHIDLHPCAPKEKVMEILKTVPRVNVNIFIEHLFEDLFCCAEKNYFLPNPDYSRNSEGVIASCDLILCRTKEAEKIFKQISPNTYFLGFTSIDKHDSSIVKDYRRPLHLSSNKQKGSEAIYQVWECQPHFPLLTAVSAFGLNDNPNIPNVDFINMFVHEEIMHKIQNEFGIHLCPSETEGFGHYIMEAMSTEAVVVTTDAPPMNEFIQDKGCLAGYYKTNVQDLATTYYVDPLLLSTTIENLFSLSLDELREIGRNNRIEFLKKQKQFRDKLELLIGSTQDSGSYAGGNTIILSGENLSTVVDVLFGSQHANFTILSSNAISVIVPPGIPGTVDITLATIDGSQPFYSMNKYTYLPPILDETFSLKGPTVGTNIVPIRGQNLSQVVGITFGSKPAAEWTIHSPTYITVKAPPGEVGACTLTLTVLCADQLLKLKRNYLYVTPEQPKIHKLEEGFGGAAGGNRVVIKGENFTGAHEILFGKTNAVDFLVESDNSITATAPPGAIGKKVTVSVKVAKYKSAATKESQYEYLGPIVFQLSHLGGPAAGGNIIYLYGRFFTGVTDVYFDKVKAIDFTVESDESIKVRVPPGMPGEAAVEAAYENSIVENMQSCNYNYFPVEPPLDFTGEAVGKNTYILTWKKSTDGTVVAYHLYKNGIFARRFTNKEPLNCKLSFTKKKDVKVYTLTAVNKWGVESEKVKVSLK